METAAGTTSDTRLRGMVAALQRPELRAITASGKLFESDRTVIVNTTSGSVTLALPEATRMGGLGYRVVKTVAANAVIIDPAGAETVNGAASFSFSTQWQQVVVVSDGSQWYAA